jgi:hypothetical protein
MALKLPSLTSGNKYCTLKLNIMSHEKNHGLIEALNNCAAECNHCATACLDEADVKMLTKCIRLDWDCADICRLAATLVARGSDHANHVLRECAEVCEACAEECEKHADHMEHCRKCAEACRHCVEVCQQGAEV